MTVFLFVCLMQIRRHQFMGSQVVKVFAPRDDEVSFTTHFVYYYDIMLEFA